MQLTAFQVGKRRSSHDAVAIRENNSGHGRAEVAVVGCAMPQSQSTGDTKEVTPGYGSLKEDLMAESCAPGWLL